MLDNIFGWPDITCQPQGFEATDDIPTDVNLPPAATEARRVGVGVVIAVPVLSPGAELQRPEPPDVSARVYAFGQARRHVQQAIDEHLEVQTVDQPDRPDPEEGLPAESEPGEYGQRDNRNLQPPPDTIPSPVEVWAPAPDFAA